MNQIKIELQKTIAKSFDVFKSKKDTSCYFHQLPLEIHKQIVLNELCASCPYLFKLPPEYIKEKIGNFIQCPQKSFLEQASYGMDFVKNYCFSILFSQLSWK